MEDRLLQVEGLRKSFSGFAAVKDLSFTVNRGDVYGFLGQNGAGKSTTLRMLLKLIRPDAGKIIFAGKEILHESNDMLHRTGAVIEKPDVYKYLSAYDNLRIFAKLSGKKPTRNLLMEQLKMVGLEERSSSKVKTFSQGMKQRLGIAIALIHSPDLIILDEPLNGLDPQGIADMRELIMNLSREQGRTVIISSHLLNEIEIVANRMIIIHHGEKIAEGKVSEMLDPANTIVEIDTTDNHSVYQQLLQSEWAEHLENMTDKIRFHISRDRIPELASSLAGKGIGIISLRPRHSLEDYFLSLTNDQADVYPVSN